MELIFFLIVAFFIFNKLKKAAGIHKKLSDLQPEDFRQIKEQGTMDLQVLLNKLEDSSAKKSSRAHSGSDYNNKNYVAKQPTKPWENSSSSKHVHSDSDYTTRNYSPKKSRPRPLETSDEKTVKRGLLDQRDSEVTVIRKNYD